MRPTLKGCYPFYRTGRIKGVIGGLTTEISQQLEIFGVPINRNRECARCCSSRSYLHVLFHLSFYGFQFVLTSELTQLFSELFNLLLETWQ